MKEYEIAVVFTVSAESYEEAKQKLTDTLNNVDNMPAGRLPRYEHDNDGQRVLYLHPEEQPE